MSASIILVIQDAEEVSRRLEAASHVVKKAPDAQAALALAQQETPELMLIEGLSATPALADMPVIFLVERRDARELAQAFQLGAIDVFVKPLPAPALAARIEARLEQLASERTAHLEGTERRVARLLRAMQWHESALGGQRAQRLAQYARALAQAAGARDVACDILAKAAPLHDVGRLAAPATEFERHAALGGEIIGEHDDPILKLARTIALTHHERWDGRGYPGGLQGDKIPWAGRVMAIVDAFETMTAGQHGSAAMSVERAAAEIGVGAGKQFDATLVQAFRKALPAFRKVREAYADPGADSAEDFLIGAPAPVVEKPEPPAPAGEDDLVIGAPARAPVDADDLTMMGSLRLGSTTLGVSATSSNEKLREAIQRAAAKAQATQAARRGEAPPEVEPKLADPEPKTEALTRAQETLAQAQRERAAAEAALAQSQAQAVELAALRTRVQQLETENAGATAALVEAHAELECARVDLAELKVTPPEHSQPPVDVEGLRVRIAQLEGERAAGEAALAHGRMQLQQMRSALEAEQANVARLEGERAAGEAALAQARKELQQARSALEAAQAPSPVDVDAAHARITQLERERSAGEAALAQSRKELQQARSALEAAQAELRAKAEQALSPLDVEALHARINQLEGERTAAEAALAQARTVLQQAHSALESQRAELQAARDAADADRVQARTRLEQAHSELETLRAREQELQAELIAERERVLAQPVEDLSRDEEALAALAAARAATERELAEAAAQRLALEAAALAGPPPARGSYATRIVVAFLFGLLVSGGAYLMLFKRVTAPVPTPAPQAAPAELPALFDGPPLELRVEGTPPAAK